MFENIPPGYRFNPYTGNFEPVQMTNQQMANQMQKGQQVPQMAEAHKIAGKFIGNINEITIKDVPNDGTPGIFVLSDMSAIIAKAWTANGNIQTEVYRLDRSQQQPTPEQVIMESLQRIEGMLAPKKPTKKTEGGAE